MAFQPWRTAWATGQECRRAAPAATLPQPSEEDEEDGTRWEEDGPLLPAGEGRTSLPLSTRVAASSAGDTRGWVSSSSCGCCRHGWATIAVAAGLPGLWSGGRMGYETPQQSSVSSQLKNRREKWKPLWLELPGGISTADSDLPARVSHQIGVVGAGARASQTCL